ncbi:MAG: hypothetical protein ACLPV8_07385 [Steroidobacteraceae bacterium]
MATRTKQGIVVPAGGNRTVLTKMFRAALESRGKFQEQQHEQFVRGCELKSQMLRAMAKAQGYKRIPQSAEEIAKRKELYAKFRRGVRKSDTKHPRSHNPLQFPPYAGAGSVHGGSGVLQWNPYGRPSAAFGETGGDLAVWQSSMSGSGSGYAATDVGFFYYAQTSGTLIVTAYFSVEGSSAYLYAPARNIHASGYAAVVVQINGPSGILANTPATIYNNSVTNAPDYSYPSGYFNVRAATPVKAHTWYTILGGTVQDVYADPDCDAEVAITFATVTFFGYYQD